MRGQISVTAKSVANERIMVGISNPDSSTGERREGNLALECCTSPVSNLVWTRRQTRKYKKLFGEGAETTAR